MSAKIHLGTSTSAACGVETSWRKRTKPKVYVNFESTSARDQVTCLRCQTTEQFRRGLGAAR